MNYYIDEEMMQIKEKNIYTATEVVTLLPLRGIQSFRKFYANNRWSRAYLPNHRLKVSYTEEVKKTWLKQLAEFLLNNFIGTLLDRALMKLTDYRWQKKTSNKKLNSRGIVMGMDASRHYAKPDPGQFQEKLVMIYDKKISHLFRSYESKAKTIY